MSYRPFVIISMPRSGTHLLRSSLESHPAVICQAEPFNANDRRLPYSLDTPVEEILAGWVFRDDVAPEIEAVGFVLHAYNPWEMKAFAGDRLNPPWERVWKILDRTDGLRVLHLKRRNLLLRHRSQVTSRATGKWHEWDPDRVRRLSHLAEPPSRDVGPRADAPPVVELDPQRLRVDFEDVERWHRKAENVLSSRPRLEVVYETLCDEYSATCRKIQEFLDLEVRELEPAVKKLETRSPGDSIGNFDDLAEHFRDSRWSAFFDL